MYLKDPRLTKNLRLSFELNLFSQILFRALEVSHAETMAAI
jgi:hypothetical protein